MASLIRIQTKEQIRMEEEEKGNHTRDVYCNTRYFDLASDIENVFGLL
jgi:hypothetical protein